MCRCGERPEFLMIAGIPALFDLAVKVVLPNFIVLLTNCYNSDILNCIRVIHIIFQMCVSHGRQFLPDYQNLIIFTTEEVCLWQQY